MPIDPQAAAILEMMRDRGGLRVHQLTPEEARAQMAAWQLPVEPDPAVVVEDKRIPGPAGKIPIRIYRPAADHTLPVVVFFHGGGWVIGGIDSHHGTCQLLAPRIGAVLVSVDYCLAPEHCYPAPPEDAY